MIKTIISLTRWLVTRLDSIVAWLESKGSSTDIQSKFVDLAPTDKADKAGVYSEAILYATNNVKVFNIALTGPYGSGKSSIIQSFLKKYRRPALHISLAAFVPETEMEGGKVSRPEIERSILQQMLYGADADKLPLSRFKRIQSPGVWSFLKSLYITLGILALWYVFHLREDIIGGTFFVPFAFSNWFNLGVFALAAIFLWVTLHRIYIASFGLSLKSISLKEVEIGPAIDDQTSILNRHLDEIVYFFQSTKYDLVIIEDLDRFNNADIFVTLREINSLVNENARVMRTIRFLYALRDDMFVTTDRTKFFEFIIPVIPIINTSNSIDMVLEQERRLELDGRLDRQFLREVSRYLNDLRLIQNIFNEYAIYMANLETDGENLLNANRLLAILIYKNVYPKDFEQLHRGEGNLARILDHQGELIKARESALKAEIGELEDLIEVAERQTPLDLRELRQIYAMAIIEKLPADVQNVSHDKATWISVPQLSAHDNFEQLIEAPQLFYQDRYNYTHRVDVPQLHDKAEVQKSYKQRKEEIEAKAVGNKNKALHKIRDLRSKISVLHKTKLNELLRVNAECVQDLFDTFGENGDLARFLILEGYLDDTYYQYTSLFHSGRLSPNDNKFLIQIRAFVTPEPGFPIDNPQEVIAAMRDEDFRQSYALNVKLVDSLLSDRARYRGQTQKLLEYLSSEFENCEDFFDAYYSSGLYVERLLSGLADAWEDLVPTVMDSSNNISHVSQLISKLPEKSLRTLARDFDELPEFVSANLPDILVNIPKLAPKRLACLDFEVKDLNAIKEHSEIVRFMFEKGLFEITITNLEHVYESILEEKALLPMRERNFTAIRSANNSILMKRIERDFDRYFRDVLLELEENSKEDISAILAVISRSTFDLDDIRLFLDRQTTLLPSLEEVPERVHSMLFQLGKIEPTWMNCLAYIKGNVFDEDLMAEYFDRDDVRNILLEQPVPDDSNSFGLREFLFKAGSLSDSAYREYVRALPRLFNSMPIALEPTKLRILIDEGKVTFSKDNLDSLSDHRDLQTQFVAANIDTYLADPEDFALDDDLQEELLRSEIDNDAKLGIIELMDLETLEGLPERAALIGSIIKDTDANISKLNGNIAQSLIKHSKSIEIQISLLNKYHDLMTDEEVRSILAELPRPFSEIKIGYGRPRLKKNSENAELVKWLDSRNIISSWSEGGVSSNEIRVYLFRR